MGRDEWADPPHGSGSKEVEHPPPEQDMIDDSNPPKDTNRQTHTPAEDSIGAQLLNAIALQKVLSSARPPPTSSGSTTKRKHQKSKAPQGFPEKRKRGYVSASEAGEGKVVVDKGHVATNGKLRRVQKLASNTNGPKQNHLGSEGDVFALPDVPVVKRGRPKASTKQRQQEPSVMAADQSAPEQANTAKTSNMSSKRTQRIKRTKTKSKVVEEDTEKSPSTSRAKLSDESRSATSNREREQLSDRPDPEPPSHARVRRSPRTKKDIQPAEPQSREREDHKRSRSSDGRREENGPAQRDVNDENNGEVDAEAGESHDDDPNYNPSEDGNYVERENEDDDHGGLDEDDDNHGKNDNEEDNESSPEEIEQNFEKRIEDSVESIGIEMFGQKANWATVLEGALEVGLFRQKGKQVKRLPKIQTRTLDDMATLISEVKTTYESLLSYQGLDHDNRTGYREQLVAGLGDIKDSIAEISETAAGNKSREMIQDIYAHAIPSLVNLLKVALRCRTRDYSQEHDIDALKEIVGLQRSILDLCEKAAGWKAKPLTKRPIINSTTKKIYPSLRKINKTFQKKLDERELEWALKEQDDCLRRLREKRFEQDLQQKEKQKREREESRRRIAEDLASQMPLADRSSRIQFNNDNTGLGPSSHQHPSPNIWTDAEIHELLVQLQRKGYRDLPGLRLQRHSKDSH